MPVGADRGSLPVVKAPDGVVGLTGVARVPEERPFALAERQEDGVVWQNLDLEGIAAQLAGRCCLRAAADQRGG